MKSILIVEDDITYGMMLKTWLSKKGFQVASVSSIARAQKHLETEGADLILSDLRLPDKDGIDLLKWLVTQGMSIPLIMMTSYADIQSAVQAMKLGASDYVAKPVNPDELLKKIGEAMKQPSVSPKQAVCSEKGNNTRPQASGERAFYVPEEFRCGKFFRNRAAINSDESLTGTLAELMDAVSHIFFSRSAGAIDEYRHGGGRNQLHIII